MSLNIDNKNSSHYFNKASLLGISFTLILFAVVNYTLLINDVSFAISKLFYIKLLTCLIFLLASKNQGDELRSLSTAKRGKPLNRLEAAFHFSSFCFAIWLGIVSYASKDYPVSKFVGVFLFFGFLAAFNLASEVLNVLRVKLKGNVFTMILLERTIKISVFSILVFAFYFLFFGDFSWAIKPFYEWQ